MPATYQDRLKHQLSVYKTEVLGVTVDGVWAKNGRSYSHILPVERKYENLLSPYRDDLCRYLKKHPEITLHRDFHHLNSSQAMCLNLFFPLVTEDKGRSILASALGPDREMAAGNSWWFEKVLDPKEETNFDFLYRKADDATAYFEIKLSEGGFGTAEADKRHLGKLATIYQPRLKDRVDATVLDPKEFFPRYQLCRNFSYLERPTDDLFIVYPKANAVLTKELAGFLAFVNKEDRTRVATVYLEDLVTRIVDRLPADALRLRQHYREFAEKYFVQ